MSDDDFDFEDTTPDGMKSLRKAYEKLQKDLNSEKESNKDLRSFKRTHGIAEKLKELGAKPGLADLVPESVEAENVGAWLTEKADLFGWKPQQPTEDPANTAEAAAQSRIAEAATQLPGDISDNPDLKALLDAPSADAIANFIYARQAGIA